MPRSSRADSDPEMGASRPVIMPARHEEGLTQGMSESSGNRLEPCRSFEPANEFYRSVGSNGNKENTFGGNQYLSLDVEESGRQASGSTNRIQQKARKLLTLSPGSLKPSASTSCLFSDSVSAGAATSVTNTTLDANVSRASLTHEWRKFKTLSRCRECNLPVYFNGRECSLCGFVAHKKCLAVLVIKCSRRHLARSGSGLCLTDITQSKFKGQLDTQHQIRQGQGFAPTSKPIFGKPIDIDSYLIIDFIGRFVHEIDSRGLTSRGIYRVSSIKSKVDRLCTYYDQNLSCLVDLSSFHPNIIANALKMYLRQLPEPLLTDKLYNRFICVAKKYSSGSTGNNDGHPSHHSSMKSSRPLSIGHQRKSIGDVDFRSHVVKCDPETVNTATMIDELRDLTGSLPPINRELIAIIMRHLKRVADMSEENQMSAKNLSIIFGPTLLSASDKSLAIVDNIHQAKVVELMIEWAELIFPHRLSQDSEAVIKPDCPDQLVDNLEEPKREKNKVSAHFDVRPFSLGRAQPHLPDFQSDTRGQSSNQSPTEPRIRQFSKTERPSSVEERKSPDSRDELKELRRKFFTITQPTRIASSDVLSEYQKSETRNPEEVRVVLPHMSIPVIKVHPYYCDTLKK